MIISPLEQFNVLSVYDFNVGSSTFGTIYAKVLLEIWHVFYNLLDNDLSGASLWMGIFGTFFVETASLSWYAVFGSISSVLYRITTTTLPGDSILDLVYLNLYSESKLVRNALLGAPSQHALVHQLSFAEPTLPVISTTGANAYFAAQDIVMTLTFYTGSVGGAELLTWDGSQKDSSYLILSLNTSTIWLSLGFIFITFFLTTSLASVGTTLLPKNNWQAILETIYQIILGVVNENAGSKGLKHFPLIFTTFMIILVCNVLGMIPYSFTVTSHLIVTFSAALAAFIGINILGILKNRRHFLSLFFPPGAPLGLAPLLVFIELVSYVFRVLSLSIRLFANLMSGHTLLKILCTFAWAACQVSFAGTPFLIPCVVIIFLVTGLELAIACLQAYIFSVLLCIYINDAFNLH